jgi:hypothetical protein
MRFRLLLCFVLLARAAAAQAPDSTRRAPRTTVSGVVRDSIARMPLAGAVVQLVAADSLATSVGRTTVSDSLGRFTFADVPAGRYMLGFFHAMLDSLGVEPTWHEVHVDGYRPVRADLAIPSATRLRTAICGPGPDSGGVVVGVVRNALGRAPAAGVTVTGEWLELSLTPKGLRRRYPRLVATTTENGRFAICHLPSAATIALVASRGADSTDRIEVELPADRFLLRELYLGSARIVVTADTALGTDTLAPRVIRQRTGDGRLSGVVVTAVTDRPLASAEVSMPDGPQTRTNERGEWTLAGAPDGTRILEVRAVGYYPERRAVNVVAGEAPIRTVLSTMPAELDTVKITASHLQDRNLSGFEDRRRSGVGRYLTAEDVARQRPLVTSDLFRFVPGLRVDRNRIGETEIRMRGTFEARCSPVIYLDGNYMGDLRAGDIDGWVRPDEVAGIEIYTGPVVPAQFSTGRSGVGASRGDCGSIVIWTKSPPTSSKVSWTVRIVTVVALAAFALSIEALTHRR